MSYAEPCRHSAAAASQTSRRGPIRRAFSTIELPQIAIVIGILAAFFGLPHLLRSDEQAKALEAFRYLADVREAQREHEQVHGRFADEIGQLDLTQNAPAYFSVGLFAPPESGSQEDHWSLTLTRSGGMTGGYGDYTITFTEQGYDAARSDIADVLCPPGNWQTTP